MCVRVGRGSFQELLKQGQSHSSKLSRGEYPEQIQSKGKGKPISKRGGGAKVYPLALLKWTLYRRLSVSVYKCFCLCQYVYMYM